jgi:hypothetical protein
MESDDLSAIRHSGVGPSDQPGMTNILTKTGRGLIATPMINAATIVIVRRRRTSAVWADICV